MARSVLPVMVGVMLMSVACSSGPSTGAAGSDDATPSDDEAARACIELDELEQPVDEAPVDTDAEFPWRVADPDVLTGFDVDEIIPGGPPPDGIEPIDDPCFDDLAAADEWLEPDSPVIAIEVDGQRRAYPLAILTQHEIVNDVIAGEPVAVTYCPLCNSGVAFERTVDGQVLDFGTSGRLYRANLVMYDRQNKTLWPQFTGTSVAAADSADTGGENDVGVELGTELDRIATSLLGWAQFRDTAPDGVVLSRESTDGRSYGRNPYPGYEDDGSELLYQGPRDDRLPPETRVVGLGEGADATAITLASLREQRVVDLEVEGAPVSVWWAPGQASALDRSTIADGREVGSTVAFDPRLDDGTQLTFEPADRDDRFVDRSTGSTWNLAGEAVDGELEGTELEPIARDDTFWFVWFGFQPETTVSGGDAVR